MKRVIFSVALALFACSLVFGHGSGSHRSRMDPDTLCANSTNNTECRRRIEVCRNMHRGRYNRTAMYQVISNCADQLNITTLPELSSDQPQNFRNWVRENPEDKRRLFSCVHQGLYNEDGSLNRTALLDKVNTLLEGRNEPDLLAELRSRVQTCPNASQRREFFRCVFSGCATP